MWAKIVYQLIKTVGTVSVAAALFMGFLVLRDWTAGGASFKDAVSNQFDWVQRVVFKRHDHKPAPESVDREPWTEVDEKAAVAMAKDTEGEFEIHPDDPPGTNRRDEAMRKAGNIILRAIVRGMSVDVHFRLAHMWLPFTWVHQEHVSWKAVLIGGWKDRDLETTRKGIPTDVLERARKIWKEIRKSKPDERECTIILIRAIDHPFTSDSGEKKARDYIPKHYVPDPGVDEKRYRTKFFCTPAEAERVKALRQKRSDTFRAPALAGVFLFIAVCLPSLVQKNG